MTAKRDAEPARLTKTQRQHRVEKLLEDVCVEVSVVASDIFGVSGRAMLPAMIIGERDPKALAELARSRMRTKIRSEGQAPAPPILTTT